MQLYKDKIEAIITLIYFVPASPTETRTPLKHRFKNFLPELLLIAEQKDGSEYQNTVRFLEKNNYKIVTFELFASNSYSVWSECNDEDFENILNERATLIKEEFLNYTIEKIG